MDWNNFLREVFAAEIIANPIAIGGPNTTVEVARKKNHQGRNLPQQWVFGGICRGTRECFMYNVPDRSGSNFASHHCAIHSTRLDTYVRTLCSLWRYWSCGESTNNFSRDGITLGKSRKVSVGRNVLSREGIGG